MKSVGAMAAIGLSLMGLISSASAQPYGYGFRGGPDYRYEERGPRFEERGEWYRERPRYRGRRLVFSEREYLRCNRDVLRAIRRGEMASGWQHYQIFGLREGRRLRC